MTCDPMCRRDLSEQSFTLKVRDDKVSNVMYMWVRYCSFFFYQLLESTSTCEVESTPTRLTTLFSAFPRFVLKLSSYSLRIILSSIPSETEVCSAKSPTVITANFRTTLSYHSSSSEPSGGCCVLTIFCQDEILGNSLGARSDFHHRCEYGSQCAK